jgi:ketosteroid isomerase-like protein
MQDAQQDSRTAATIEVIRKLEEAINGRNVDAVMALSTDDVVWETTTPPDGERHVGQAAVRAGLEGFFRSSPQATFETEEIVALGDRAFMTWRYRWVDGAGQSGHVRGVDVVRVRDGKLAEMVAYVKG